MNFEINTDSDIENFIDILEALFQTLDLPRFHTKFEWQINPEISTLCSFHLNDFVFQEGIWVWESNGVPLNNGYTNWISGYPSNKDGGGIVDCLYIGRCSKKWYDVNCDWTTNIKPMCQIVA